MSLLFYNSCYFMVIRLFSLLYNHVQQHILHVYFLLLVVDQNINHIALLITNDGSISISLFSVLFNELQEQYSYLNYPYMVMCRSRKYPYSPHRRDWNFQGGGGFCKTKKFKMYEAQMEFREGWGEFPSMGEVWIFSGTTQYQTS